MKTITIKQPFASLIVEGIKDIENRSWPTKFRGRVLIHSSNGNKFNQSFSNAQMKAISPLIGKVIQKSIESGVLSLKHEWNEENLFPFGAILGSVEIVDCVVNHESIWADKTNDCPLGGCNTCSDGSYCIETGRNLNDDFKTTYNWVLSNPIKFEDPIQGVKGKLSFWDYPGELPI